MKEEKTTYEMIYVSNELKEMANRIINTPISDFDLSVRSCNVIASTSVKTVGDLAQEKASNFLRLRNFGKKSFKELTKFLDEFGLKFGMSLYQIKYELIKKIKVQVEKRSCFNAYEISEDFANDIVALIKKPLSYIIDICKKEGLSLRDMNALLKNEIDIKFNEEILRESTNLRNKNPIIHSKYRFKEKLWRKRMEKSVFKTVLSGEEGEEQ